MSKRKLKITQILRKEKFFLKQLWLFHYFKDNLVFLKHFKKISAILGPLRRRLKLKGNSYQKYSFISSKRRFLKDFLTLLITKYFYNLKESYLTLL